MAFTLQILHASDLEGGVDAIAAAPNFAAIVDSFEAEAEAGDFGSVLLSAGDNYIPGPFFNAADFIGNDIYQDTYNALFADFLGEGEELDNVRAEFGRVDITIMNLLGFDASAIGNHEFDNGTDTFEGIIEEDVRGDTLNTIRWPGAQFPYLSSNLDFSENGDLGNLFTDDILASEDFFTPPSTLIDGTANPFKISDSTVVTTNGEEIGVVGATTQRVGDISSTGNVVDVTGGVNDMAALAANLQPEIDALIAEGIDKIVIVSHLQDFNLELELAPLLSGVDVIIAGGSDTRLADDTDRLAEGDERQGDYPTISTNADGDPVALVSTDGEYSYVGRLVIDFDENGVIVPESIDAEVSGAYVTDDQGVVEVTGAADAATAIAESETATLVQTLTTAVEDVVTESDGVVFGETEVFLEGRRSVVRTEETNLGNLTADANIVSAQAFDPDVTVSLKNGGGIRAPIGQIVDNGDGTSSFLPPQANEASGKLDGQVSELDIQNVLRFDNGLTIVDLSAADLKLILEHAVAASGPGSEPGQFPQVAGLRFSYDLDQQALEFSVDDDGTLVGVQEGKRIQSVEIALPDGSTQVIVEDGAVVDDAPESIKVVTLDFLVGDEGEFTGGDGYPYRALTPTVLETGVGERQALQEFLEANNPIDGGTPFTTAETPESEDDRIQNLAEREDSIVEAEPAGELPTVDPEFEPALTNDELIVSLADRFTGEFDPLDEDQADGAAEVVSYNAGLLYTTNGNQEQIEIFDLETSTQSNIPLEDLANSLLPAGVSYNGIQSVAASDDWIVAAIDTTPTDAGVRNEGGLIVIPAADFFDDGEFEAGFIPTGFLPDSVTFAPDGVTVAVANEGEFNSESGDDDVSVDAPGSIAIIDVSGIPSLGGFGIRGATYEFGEADFFAARDAGLRVIEDRPAEERGLDLEPEFTAFDETGSLLIASLQENNGLFAIGGLDAIELPFLDDTPDNDLLGGTFIDSGTLDHSLPGNGFDASDNNVIDIEPRDTLGLRMPDAIDVVTIGGEIFVLGANEGDGRGDAFDDGQPVEFGDEARVGELAELGLLDPEDFITEITGTDIPMEESQEVADTPVPDTAATGSFTATLDEAAGTITVAGSFSDLTSPLFDIGGDDQFGNPESAIHVHLGAAGENGPIFGNTTVTAAEDGLSGTFEGTFEVTDEQAEIFRNDGYYVNLHTENFNGGELRGQIDLPEVDSIGALGIDRLIVSTVDGDIDGDGLIDQLFSYGSRSFTIWDTSGTVIFDSGDEFERFIAGNFPERFNDDDGELGQNRSDAKGPEPEAIATGTIGEEVYAFVGAERDSGVFIYNITEPANAYLVSYLDGFGTDNIAPETIAFIPADESQTGNAQIAVAYEVSGTTAIYDLAVDAGVFTVQDFYTVALGRDFDTAGSNFWAGIFEIASIEFIAEAFDDSPEFQASIDGLTDEAGIDLVFNNALGRDATDDEQAAFQPIVADEGYDQLFLDLIDGTITA